MPGHLLAQAGVDTVILEQKSNDLVLSRIRAGMQEQVTVNIMSELGLDGHPVSILASPHPHDDQ